MAEPTVLAVIRDLAIIILAILNIALIAVLLFIAIIVWRLFRYFNREIPSFVEIAKGTLTRVEGTTDFVGTTVARPAIGAVSFLAAVQRFLRVMTSPRREEVRR